MKDLLMRAKHLFVGARAGRVQLLVPPGARHPPGVGLKPSPPPRLRASAAGGLAVTVTAR
jgi:hypothetical protein